MSIRCFSGISTIVTGMGVDVPGVMGVISDIPTLLQQREKIIMVTDIPKINDKINKSKNGN